MTSLGALPPPSTFVIGIALSAGGLEPLRTLVEQLPCTLAASVVVIQHAQGSSHVPGILRHVTTLRVKFAENGESLRVRTVYVGPPDRHLVLTVDGKLVLADAPPLRFMRPSADWFFDSMAAAFADRSIAIVLSGRLSERATLVRCREGRLLSESRPGKEDTKNEQ